MLYLILAVVSSSAVAIIMRFGEKYIRNNFAMFAANYLVCSTIGFMFLKDKNIFVMREGLPFTLILALISGCLYLTNFVFLKLNIEKNGVMLSSVFMKLGVLVPILMAITVFGETPKVIQLVGFALAIAAIIIINLEPKGDKQGNKKTAVFLLLLLLISGFTGSMANIFDKVGRAELKDSFLFFNFFTAMLLAVVITAVRKKPISWKDLVFGAAIGVPNYFASRFLLLSLGSLPAVVVYPIYNIGAIVLIGAAGLFLFRERLNLRKYIGFGIIAVSLVLLNL